MRRWETLTALAAVVLASLGSIPGLPFRYVVTAIAVVLISVVGAARLKAALRTPPREKNAFDAADRARRIRDARDRRR